MADPMNWSPFEAPGGQADNSWVGPVANAYTDAARIAVSPITRAFEQIMDQRFTEKNLRAQQEFAAAQDARAREDALLRDRENDMRQLQRVERQIELEAAAQRELEQMRLQRDEQQALAMLSATGLGGGEPSSTGGTPFGAVAGPRLDSSSFLRLPARQSPGEAPISAQDAKLLGATNLGAIADNRALAAQRAATAEADRLKAQREAQSAQAAASDAAARIAAAPISDSVKKALLGTVTSGDPTRAMTDLTDILATDERTREAANAKRTEGDADGYRDHNFGGGAIDLPLSAFADSKEYVAAKGAISGMPANAKARLELEAGRMAEATLAKIKPETLAYLTGQIPGAAKEEIAAAKAVLKAAKDEQFALLAKSLGWKDDETVLRESVMEAQRGQPSPLPFAGGVRSVFDGPSAVKPMTLEEYARKLRAQGATIEEAERLLDEFEKTNRPYIKMSETDSTQLFNTLVPPR